MSELIKDKECIECKHFLMCPGKPKEVAFCLHLKRRQDETEPRGSSICKVNDHG